MNPMSDKLYRDWQANEFSREMARETRISSALQSRPADPVNPTHPMRSSIQERLAVMSASAKGKVRQLTTSAGRPAGG